MSEPWERPFEDSDQIDLLMSVILGIAKIVGMPDGANPIEGINICRVANPRPDDLTPLELAVRGLAERAETVRVVTADRDARVADVGARIADAVAAERHAIGAWLRTSVRSAPLARNVEHGDHINDDAPPLPSLRMTLLLRDELHRQIKALEAERDRRIDPVEHARAVMTASLNGYGYGCGADSEAMFVWKNIATDRSRLLARVGADVLAEVER